MSQRSVLLRLSPEELNHISSFLHSNDVACALRMTCKEIATSLRDPEHRTVHVSDSVPVAFLLAGLNRFGYNRLNVFINALAKAGHMDGMDAVVRKVQAIEVIGDRFHNTRSLLFIAAEAGRLEACKWLLDANNTLFKQRMRGKRANPRTLKLERVIFEA